MVIADVTCALCLFGFYQTTLPLVCLLVKRTVVLLLNAAFAMTILDLI
jgi:hypothetical protein